MKKKKIIACFLAVTATLALASIVSGCSAKKKFDQWTCNHVYDTGVVTKTATCTEEGELLYTCVECGKTYTENIELLPHTYDSGVITVAPTCTKTGVKTYTCLDCDYEKTEQLPKKSHNVVEVSQVDATCLTAGYTAWSYCSDCNTVLSPKREISALGHIEETIPAVSATCTTAGKTTGIKCSNCGEILVVQTTIPATGHTSITLEGVQATCEQDGLTSGSKCSSCDMIFTAQTVVPAIGHSVVVDESINATCTTTGKTEGSHCSVCDKILVAQTVIPATGHTVVIDEVISATCTTSGKTEGSHCSSCHKILVAQEDISPLGHVEVEDVAVYPTCTTTGKTAGSHCGVCGATLVEQNTVQALGHKPVTIEGISPTCTETGLTVGSKCSVCNTVLEEQTVLAKLAHVDGNIDSFCDTCGIIEFGYYQNPANYTIEAYTVEEKLGGKVARLHVATTTANDTVTKHRFTWVDTGTIHFTYNLDLDVFEYEWLGYLEDYDGNGQLTHDELQYNAFEVDGEYYVDVYFADSVSVDFCVGLKYVAAEDIIVPLYESRLLSNIYFMENTYTVLLKNCHSCVDLDSDGICEDCGFKTTVLSGKTYRMYLEGMDYDGDISNGYEDFGGVVVDLGDVENSDYYIRLNAMDYVHTCYFELYGPNSLVGRYEIPDDCITVTYNVNSSKTEAYFDFYFAPNKEFTFVSESEGVSVTFNTNNLRVKAGELVLAEETVSVSTLSLRSVPVTMTTIKEDLDNEDEWTCWW